MTFFSKGFELEDDEFQQPDWPHRRKLINDYCSNNNLILTKPKHLDNRELPDAVRQHYLNVYQKQLVQNIVRIPILNLNWCLVPKVASTSISTLILPYLKKLNGNQKFPHLQKEVWARAGHVSYNDFLKMRNKTTTFLITRHPFARIASAYRNKLEDRSRSHDGEYFYNTYSRQIIKLARGSWKLGDAEPTFSEFIFYLLHTDVDNYDEHWQPIAIRCRLCQLQYFHILHYESLDADWNKFLEDINLKEDLKLPWENKGTGHGKLKEYFQFITQTEIQQLYLKLEADFKLFEYSVDDEF